MYLKEETKNDENKRDENSLIDLHVADEQSDSTKGGAPGTFAGTWTLDKSKTQGF